MARPRRAKARRSRVVVPLAIAALVLAGLVVWRSGSGSSTADPAAAPAGPAGAATAPAAPNAPGSGSGSASASSTASIPASARPAGAEVALAACRARVSAADDVLAAARTGIGHWSAHVQAQTDADNGKISRTAMDAVFKRTRLAGPADLRRYDRARRQLDQASAAPGASCDPVPGAPAEVAGALADCRQRQQAQQRVLRAAAPAMADWRDHLAAMRRSRMTHVPDAQGIWLEAWRAAPPNLDRYAAAVEGFDPPVC